MLIQDCDEQSGGNGKISIIETKINENGKKVRIIKIVK